MQDAAGARLRLFGVVAQYLAAAAPLVVVLDDLQWADITSTRLLVQLAAAAPPGLLVVATCRTSEAAALTPTLAALTRLGSVRVDPRRAGPGRRPGAGARSVGRGPGRAGGGFRAPSAPPGNPLFVTLLAGAPDGAAAPRLLQDVVLQRLQTLPPETVDLLRTAAIAGQEVDVEVLAEVSGARLDDVIEALDQARAADLLSDDDTPLGTYRFAHALVRDALDSGHSRLRRARWHRRFAEVTERQYAGDDDRAGQVARHWLAAAELDPACAGTCRRAHRPGRPVGDAPPRARGRRRVLAGVPGRRAAGRRGPAGTVRGPRRAHRGAHRRRRDGRRGRVARRGVDGRGR